MAIGDSLGPEKTTVAYYTLYKYHTTGVSFGPPHQTDLKGAGGGGVEREKIVE